MSIRFFPIPDGIETTASPPTYISKWKSVGEHRETVVNAYAIAFTPSIVATIYGILYRQDIKVTKTAYDQYSISVPYGTRKNETGEWTWDFDTTGGTVHITNGKSERRYPSTAPDQKAAIAVDRDQVNGTDIIIPAMKINVSYKHPQGQITLAQAKFLNSITGMTNSAPFLTFAAGEALFLGARGADGTATDATVSYQFAMSANANNLTIGAVANIVKKGHEVAWIKYEDNTETISGTIRQVRVPKFVYVDKVYEETDLATALGFG
jgi:hypothetical protein